MYSRAYRSSRRRTSREGRSLTRSVEALILAAGRVLVGVPEDCVEHVRASVAESVVVLAGGSTRMETFLRLFQMSTAPLLVQHDVVHPFATRDVARRVVAVAEKAGKITTRADWTLALALEAIVPLPSERGG